MRGRGSLWIKLGLLLIAAALLLTAYNLYDRFRAERSAQTAAAQIAQLTPEEGIPDYLTTPEMEMPTQRIDGRDYIGILRIPTLDLTLPIISQWSYPDLKVAPCRYEGSAYTDDLILAAHNYPAHFGNLKTLHPGDQVSFTDIDGNQFHYQVVELETLQPTAIEEMEAGEWDLTLFTCTLGGQSRVTVRCERTDRPSLPGT